MVGPPSSWGGFPRGWLGVIFSRDPVLKDAGTIDLGRQTDVGVGRSTRAWVAPGPLSPPPFRWGGFHLRAQSDGSGVTVPLGSRSQARAPSTQLLPGSLLSLPAQLSWAVGPAQPRSPRGPHLRRTAPRGLPPQDGVLLRGPGLPRSSPARPASLDAFSRTHPGHPITQNPHLGVCWRRST